MSLTLTDKIGFGSGAATGGTPYSESSSEPRNFATGGFNTYTMLTREWAIDNDSTINTIGVHSTTSGTVVVKIIKSNGGASYDVTYSESFSHGGGGWQDFTLTTPQVIPSSGTYYAGGYSATSMSSKASMPRSYYAGDAVGTGLTFTEDTSSNAMFRVTGTKP